MIYEFPRNYDNDPSDTAAVGSGSGVHLNKDVTFSFGFSDRQTTRINSVIQATQNPFFSGYRLDIMDTGGNVLYTGYRSGALEPRFTLTEDQNTNLFGSYQKDFGIQLTVSDLTTSTTTVAEVYTYGNYADISGVLITDGVSKRYYTGQSDFDTYTGTGYSSGVVTGYIQVDITFSGDPEYTKYERVDFYFNTGSGVAVTDNDFLKSFYTFEQKREVSFEISLERLSVGTDYYFYAVPYSAIGSGEPWRLGPHSLVQTPYSGVPLSTDELNITQGDASANFDLQTGTITDTYSIIHTLSTGNYKSVEYHIQVTDASGLNSTHKCIITHTGTGVSDYSLSEYAISDDSHLELQSTSGLEARVTDSGYSPATYKMLKMSM